jgi:FtsZ-binding cell division protein ZapB
MAKKKQSDSSRKIESRICQCQRAIQLIQAEIEELQQAQHQLDLLDQRKEEAEQGLNLHPEAVAQQAMTDSLLAVQTENPVRCMRLVVEEDARTVELITDTQLNTHAEWIPGEGADICLYREQSSNRVVGVCLELGSERLEVYHQGSLRVNTGFKPESLVE